MVMVWGDVSSGKGNGEQVRRRNDLHKPLLMFSTWAPLHTIHTHTAIKPFPKASARFEVPVEGTRAVDWMVLVCKRRFGRVQGMIISLRTTLARRIF